MFFRVMKTNFFLVNSGKDILSDKFLKLISTVHR